MFNNNIVKEGIYYVLAYKFYLKHALYIEKVNDEMSIVL